MDTPSREKDGAVPKQQIMIYICGGKLTCYTYFYMPNSLIN